MLRSVPERNAFRNTRFINRTPKSLFACEEILNSAALLACVEPIASSLSHLSSCSDVARIKSKPSGSRAKVKIVFSRSHGTMTSEKKSTTTVWNFRTGISIRTRIFRICEPESCRSHGLDSLSDLQQLGRGCLGGGTAIAPTASGPGNFGARPYLWTILPHSRRRMIPPAVRRLLAQDRQLVDK